MGPVAGADRPLQGEKLLGEPAEDLQSGVLVVQEHVAPHDRIGGGDTGEVAKSGGGILDDLAVGDAPQVICHGLDSGAADQLLPGAQRVFQGKFADPVDLARAPHEAVGDVAHLLIAGAEQLRIHCAVGHREVVLDGVDVVEKQLTGHLRVAQRTIAEQMLEDVRQLGDLVILLVQFLVADHGVISYPSDGRWL